MVLEREEGAEAVGERGGFGGKCFAEWNNGVLDSLDFARRWRGRR